MRTIKFIDELYLIVYLIVWGEVDVEQFKKLNYIFT